MSPTRRVFARAALLPALLVVAACAAPPTPAIEADLAPSPEPAATEPAPPTQPEPEPEPSTAAALTDGTWRWASYAGPAEAFDVAPPESYLATFNADGTISLTADCNKAGGSYTDEAGALQITVAQMTRAQCPPGSRSDQFVKLLGSAARYFFEGERLHIDLVADGGTLVFAPAGGDASGAAGPLSTDALANATYGGILDEPFALSDGVFEGTPFAEGYPDHPTVRYVADGEVRGDLDGDGVEDVVVFLVEGTGGTAGITHASAQLDRDGQPVDAGAVRLDEVEVKSASIADGLVTLEIVTRGPGDADCCMSHKATRTLALVDGSLAEVGGGDAELARVSAADLVGTRWTLVELDADRPALADAAVTLGFADGRIAGSAGCNQYNGSFALGEDNPMTLTAGPFATTRMACSDPILQQETAYLAALEGVSQWGYDFGRLALFYQGEGEGLRRLLFAPEAGAPAE